MSRYKDLDSMPVPTRTFNFIYLWVTWKRSRIVTSFPNLNPQEVSNWLLQNESSERTNTWKYLVHYIFCSKALSFSEDSRTAFKRLLWPLTSVFSTADRSWTASWGTGNECKEEKDGGQAQEAGALTPYHSTDQSQFYQDLCRLPWICVDKYNGNLRKHVLCIYLKCWLGLSLCP